MSGAAGGQAGQQQVLANVCRVALGMVVGREAARHSIARLEKSEARLRGLNVHRAELNGGSSKSGCVFERRPLPSATWPCLLCEPYPFPVPLLWLDQL